MERLEQLEKYVLGQVLCLVMLSDELVGDVEDPPPLLADDRGPRGLVSGETLLDELVRRSWLSNWTIRAHFGSDVTRRETRE
jgi:hypothetical protein